MDSRVRHIAKSITWRFIATVTTLGVAAYIQGGITSKELGLLVVLDVTMKLLFYYLHERFWFNLKSNIQARVRHVIKAFSWRFIAGLTTFILVVLIFKQEQDAAYEKAGSIVLIETVLKMLFYYGHEEAWYRINLGLDNRQKNRSQS